MFAGKNFAHFGTWNPAGTLELIGVDAYLLRVGGQDEAHHQRRREWPGLAGDIFRARRIANDTRLLGVEILFN